MKKAYFLLITLIAGFTSYAQSVPDAGMENWRANTTGTDTVINIFAPVQWFGFDSLIIADGQAFSFLIGSGKDWHAQLYEEDTIVNSGSHSAKLMTLQQDVVGLVPGLLSNAQVSVNVAALATGGSLASATTFSGGTPETLKIASVSAYVAYFPGIDSTTHLMGGNDTALLTVEAYGIIHGVDSLLGTGIAQIAPGSSFTQVTATIAYTDTVDSVGVLRVFFASSGGGAGGTLDSSTLYVDDISVVGEPEPVVDHTGVNILTENDNIKVYPNPATGMFYINGPGNEALTCKLFSVSGQEVAAKTVTGNASVDISYLPAGLYFYAITDGRGITVQRGKMVVSE